jgi:hypothetical protein
MFYVYAVRVVNGHKHRFFMGERETLFAAKHLCNCCVCDYAYVKDARDGGTVFFLPYEDPNPYDESPIGDPKEMHRLLSRPLRPVKAKILGPRARK